MALAPGIHFGVDVGEYHADPCAEPSITQSLIKTLLEQSPAHARAEHPRLALPLPAEVEDEHAEKYDKAKVIGDAVHGMLLGRGKALAIGDYATWQSKDARQFRADALEDGFTPILEKHHRIALTMFAAACVQLEQRGLTDIFRADEGHSEVVLVWRMGAIYCRTLIDRLSVNRLHVIDYKSTAMSAAPQSVGSLMANAGWQIQAAMHELGLDALDPDNAGRRRHTFIAQEQYPPFALCHYDMTEAHMHLGRTDLHIGLNTWQDCVRRKVWPAYPIETQYPELPEWLKRKVFERQLEHEHSMNNPAHPMTNVNDGNDGMGPVKPVNILDAF